MMDKEISMDDLDLTQNSAVDCNVSGAAKQNDKRGNESRHVATFGELFSFATCGDRTLILLAVVASVAHGASWPLLFLIFGNMTNKFMFYGQDFGSLNGTNLTTDSIGGNFSLVNITGVTADMGAFEDIMTDYALKYVYIGLGVFVLTYVHVTFLQMSCERQTHKLRRAFFKALLRENIGWFDQQQSGELTTRLADDLERVKDGTGDKFGLAVQFLSQFVAGFVIGFIRGWKLTLVMMSLTPVLAIFAGILGRLMTTYSAREQQQYANAGAIAEEVLSCVRTVISFNGHSQELNKYGTALAGSRKLGMRKSVFAGLSVGLMFLFMFGAYGLAFWFGSTQVNDHNNTNGEDGLSPGAVLSVFFSVMAGSFALGGASPHITSILTAKGAAGIIYSIIRDEPEIDSSDPRGQKPTDIKGHIQLSNIEFAYPTREDVQVLQNFNLDIQPGQTVALVGASGCGKSTIVNLIQRFYDPQAGKILLDGADVRDINIQWLRGNIGVVSQEPVLFGMSIAENIALGKPGIGFTEIQAAAKMANAHSFIAALPNGYKTLVGERGAQLSGGQKQRVAIARALVRDPKILLLDEATSALDSKSEGLVQAALDQARQGRTTVVVAHRLSTIQNADMIFVMDKGQLVETGKHTELMEKRGAYYNLVLLQTISEQEEQARGQESAVIDTATEDKLPQEGKFRRQISRQVSQNGHVARQVSVQSVTSQSSAKGKNLFKPKTDEEESEAATPRPDFIRMFKSNLKEWPFILFGCIAAVINGSTFPLFALFFSEIIKTFGLRGQDLLDKGLFWSLMFVAMGGVAFCTNLIQHVCFGYSGETLTARLRRATFKSILRQDVEYFDNPKHSTGALTTRLATDASMVKNATGIRLAMLIQSFFSLIAGLVIAFLYGWKLALAVLGGVPVLLLAGIVNVRLMKRNQMRDSQLLEDAGKTASECVENIRTVQSLTREEYFYQLYCHQLEQPHRENLKQTHLYGISYGFSQGVIFLLYAGAFRFGAWLVTHDGMEADLVYRVFFAIAFAGMSLGQAASFMPDYSKAQLSAAHIFSLLDLLPSIDIYSSDGVIKSHISGDIQLKNVHFSYPTRSEVDILKGIDLHVKPGQTAALVGMSGCGKSTIVSLVQRYYDPTAGAIFVEGLDIRQYNLKALRSLISVVSQEPVLFDRSIRGNIVYGLEQGVAMADVIAAAKLANAHDFISKLPEGYDTLVGEKGTQLSGGQKQRVAIARALIRNPKILLLDEATSALDTESEKIVQTALDRAREGRTCIVIAHRLSTIQNADIIYAMEHGTVVECGTHQELLAKKGAYFALVQGQKFRTDSGDK